MSGDSPKSYLLFEANQPCTVVELGGQNTARIKLQL